VSGAGDAGCSLIVLPAPMVALGDAVSLLTLGDAVAALALGVAASLLMLGEAVAALTLGDAVSALALGAAVSLLMPGDAMGAEAVLSPVFFAIETPLAEEVEDGSRVDATDGAAAALLFVVDFVAFDAFFGALSGSVTATLDDEVEAAAAGAGAGVTSGREPASAGVAWLAVAAAASLAGVVDETWDWLALATVGAAMTFASM